MKKQLVCFVAATGFWLALTLGSRGASGIGWIDNNTNLTVYGDIRLRYEADWDSHTAAGAQRTDRNRGRYRARLGFGYQLDEEWSVGARVRTGNIRSQQSPHLTFAADNGGADEFGLVMDRYFVQFNRGGFTGWAGRNATPFWQQNELFWDEDVTLTGAAGTYETKISEGKLALTGGAFLLPDGGYDLNGQMFSGQVKYFQPVDKSTFTVAAGLHYLHGQDGANYLRNRNGARDYTIGVASAQWSVRVKGIPLTLGADLFKNFMDYSAAEAAPLAAVNRDETLGYVFSATLGQLKKRRDWLVGYYYAHIETFAVNAAYAQDDWSRFGSATQSDASDFKGHEIRLAYAFSKNVNLMARMFLVDAITTRQDGNRFRLDLNWKF